MRSPINNSYAVYTTHNLDAQRATTQHLIIPKKTTSPKKSSPKKTGVTEVAVVTEVGVVVEVAVQPAEAELVDHTLMISKTADVVLFSLTELFDGEISL